MLGREPVFALLPGFKLGPRTGQGLARLVVLLLGLALAIPLAEPLARSERHPLAPCARARRGLEIGQLARPALERTGALRGLPCQGAGARFSALRPDWRSGRLRPHQLGRVAAEPPSAEAVAQQVGCGRGQAAAADLAHDERRADGGDHEAERDPRGPAAERGDMVDPIGQGRHGGQSDDLGEGEPEQDTVLGLHVGWHLMRIHGGSSFH